MNETDYLYRVEAYREVVELLRFPIVKRTACGAWIDTGERNYELEGCPLKPRFVNLKARKQYANETVAEARTAFLARNRKHIALLRARAENAEKARKAVVQWDDQDKVLNFDSRDSVQISGDPLSSIDAIDFGT